MSKTISSEKLKHFSVFHHEAFIDSYHAKLSWWHDETNNKKYRCSKCWLQSRHCYCEILDKKRSFYSSKTNCQNSNVHVSIYYDPKEVGRSANTAHVFEQLCPAISDSLISGDVSSEIQLVDQIEAEYRERFQSICVLYPSSDALLLSEWKCQRQQQASLLPNKDELLQRPVRLIALDGTFPGASRLAKYLIYSCALRGIQLPMVKLDLESGSCKSAIAGLMSQPTKEKICSFQAIVMAMEQLGASYQLCATLHNDLQDWLSYMITTRVKMGKTKQRLSNKEVDGTPDHYLHQIIINNGSAEANYHSAGTIFLQKTRKFFVLESH